MFGHIKAIFCSVVVCMCADHAGGWGSIPSLIFTLILGILPNLADNSNRKTPIDA